MNVKTHLRKYNSLYYYVDIIISKDDFDYCATEVVGTQNGLLNFDEYHIVVNEAVKMVENLFVEDKK